MAEKFKKMILKIIPIIKSNRKTAIIAAAALAVLIITIVVLVCVFSGGEGDADISWGDGITSGVPEFSGDAYSMDLTSVESYVAAYYSDVTTEQVEEYISVLNGQGIEFSSDKYPKSAVLEDKIIVIHYNVTEMRLSVTVTAKIS